MSGVLVVCVCGLGACASNCGLSNLLQCCYMSAAHSERNVRFPVLATSDGMIHFGAPFLLCGCYGCKGDLVAVLESRTCLYNLLRSFRSLSACLFSQMRKVMRVWGSTISERSKFSMKTDDDCGCIERLTERSVYLCTLQRPE